MVLLRNTGRVQRADGGGEIMHTGTGNEKQKQRAECQNHSPAPMGMRTSGIAQCRAAVCARSLQDMYACEPPYCAVNWIARIHILGDQHRSPRPPDRGEGM